MIFEGPSGHPGIVVDGLPYPIAVPRVRFLRGCGAGVCEGGRKNAEWEQLDDLQAELLLKDWSGQVGVCRTHEELLEACFAVLTAKVLPPRMGATVVAVDLISRDAGDVGCLWARLMEKLGAGELEERQMMNWVYGHCFRRYDAVMLGRFLKLAEVAPRKEKVGIAVMLGTWCGYGAEEKGVMRLIEKLGCE